ncbi:MAG: glycosyltransferase, partial [Candidatus Syntrophosphaera sp.]
RRMSAIVAADPAKKIRFALYNPRTRTVHNYPLLEELKMLDTSKRDPNKVCYVGAITRIRGIIPVLDSIQSLDVKLILAGAFDPPSLEDECRRHPSWNKVEYLGFIDRVGVSEVLSRASVGMVIWLPNENYLDSLPIKMFEYMSASMPVVASNFPNLKAIVEHYGCGLCVDPYKTEDITEAILKLLSDKDLAATMGRRGHDAILSTLNWDSQAEILCELYEEVLAR